MENNNDNKDRSFKAWFKLMWGEHYIQMFIGFLAAGILIPAFYGKDYLPIDILFGAVLIIITYKGFIQEWRDYLNNKTR